MEFSLEEGEAELVLTVKLWRHLRTEQLELDIQPEFIRLDIRGKLFQFRLPEEIKPDCSRARRSQVKAIQLTIKPTGI